MSQTLKWDFLNNMFSRVDARLAFFPDLLPISKDTLCEWVFWSLETLRMPTSIFVPLIYIYEPTFII